MSQQQSGGFGNATPVNYGMKPEIKDPEPVDTLPSDEQPPGVDEDMPQSLEEALLG